MSDALVFLNGINALTGQYLVPPLTPPEAAVLARQTQLPREKANLLERLVSLLTGASSDRPPTSRRKNCHRQAGRSCCPRHPGLGAQGTRAVAETPGRSGPPNRFKVLTYRPRQTREQ
jgi:hypothetical protein